LVGLENEEIGGVGEKVEKRKETNFKKSSWHSAFYLV
jgi:hypothetical protein